MKRRAKKPAAKTKANSHKATKHVSPGKTKRKLSPGLLRYMAAQRELKARHAKQKPSAPRAVVNKLAKHKAKRPTKKNRRNITPSSYPTYPVHSSHSSSTLNFL